MSSSTQAASELYVAVVAKVRETHCAQRCRSCLGTCLSTGTRLEETSWSVGKEEGRPRVGTLGDGGFALPVRLVLLALGAASRPGPRLTLLWAVLCEPVAVGLVKLSGELVGAVVFGFALVCAVLRPDGGREHARGAGLWSAGKAKVVVPSVDVSRTPGAHGKVVGNEIVVWNCPRSTAHCMKVYVPAHGVR